MGKLKKNNYSDIFLKLFFYLYRKIKNLKMELKNTEINVDYYKNFNLNLHKIHNIIPEISGKHNIDLKKANLWINSQLNENRRRLAKLLIKNTIYITFNELLDYIKNLTIKICEELSNSNIVYFLIDDKDDSTYFMSILSIDYIINLSLLKNSPIIIDNCSNYTLEKIGNDPIIYIDDCVYSGTKLSKKLNLIYENYVFMTNNNFPNFYMGFVGISSSAITILEYLSVSRNKLIMLDLENVKIKNPVKFNYERIFISLNEIIGEKDLFQLLFYFAPYNFKKPYISIYFDHKIADPISTFLKILMYGPILPSNLNHNHDYIEMSLINSSNYDFDQYELLEILLNEKCDKKIENIQFIPFIEGADLEIFNYIENNTILKYYWFSISDTLLKISINNCLDKNSEIEFTNVYYKEDYLENNDIVTKLNDENNRYPKSFYKNFF